MNEAGFWSTWVRPLFRCPGWLAWKVPAETRKGLPDVFYAHQGRAGWLELKYASRWPVRATTGVLVAVTPEQLAHLRAAQAAGLGAWVLLGIAQDWFLLDPALIFPETRYTRNELAARSVSHGRRRDGGKELRLALTMPRRVPSPPSAPGPGRGDPSAGAPGA
jgi:hypothetical protein